MPRKQITPDQIRCTYKRRYVPLPWGAKLDACKRLCALWHNLFGACLVLDDERFRAVCRRLVDQAFPEAQLADAIRAYHEVCTTDSWRLQNREAHLTFARFMYSERLEEWIEKGEELAEKQKQTKQSADHRRGYQAEVAFFKSLSKDQQQALRQKAIDELRMQGKLDRIPPMLHEPLIKQKLRQLVQRAMADQQRDPASIQAVMATGGSAR